MRRVQLKAELLSIGALRHLHPVVDNIRAAGHINEATIPVAYGTVTIRLVTFSDLVSPGDVPEGVHVVSGRQFVGDRVDPPGPVSLTSVAAPRGVHIYSAIVGIKRRCIS